MRLFVLASLIAAALVQQGSTISDLLELAVASERAYHATFVKLTAQETRIVEIFDGSGVPYTTRAYPTKTSTWKLRLEQPVEVFAWTLEA